MEHVFKARHGVDEVVYFMHNNRVCNARIVGITFTVESCRSVSVGYIMPECYGIFRAGQLFNNKLGLIESL